MSESVRPHGQQPTRLLCPRDSLGKNTGVGCHFLLQYFPWDLINAFFILLKGRRPYTLSSKFHVGTFRNIALLIPGHDLLAIGIFCFISHFTNEENESKIFGQYIQVCPVLIGEGGGVLKTVAIPTPNLLTQDVPARSLDLSDSQAKG